LTFRKRPDGDNLKDVHDGISGERVRFKKEKRLKGGVMAAVDTGSLEFTLTLSAEERVQLLAFLEHALRDKQVEVHRTEAFAARELVRHQADVLANLIEKLRRV
jgi:hypothetical protein